MSSPQFIFSQPPRVVPSPRVQVTSPRVEQDNKSPDEQAAAEAYHRRKISRVASKFNAVRPNRGDE